MDGDSLAVNPMTTTYPQQLAYLRIIKSRQAHVHLKAVANDTLTAEQAAHESECLSDIIAHLEMVAGCEGCADTFPFQSK